MQASAFGEFPGRGDRFQRSRWISAVRRVDDLGRAAMNDSVDDPLRVVIARSGIVGVDLAADGGAEKSIAEQCVRAGSVDVERALLQESDLFVGEELAAGIGLGTLDRSQRVVFPYPLEIRMAVDGARYFVAILCARSCRQRQPGKQNAENRENSIHDKSPLGRSNRPIIDNRRITASLQFAASYRGTYCGVTRCSGLASGSGVIFCGLPV